MFKCKSGAHAAPEIVTKRSCIRNRLTGEKTYFNERPHAAGLFPDRTVCTDYAREKKTEKIWFARAARSVKVVASRPSQYANQVARGTNFE